MFITFICPCSHVNEYILTCRYIYIHMLCLLGPSNAGRMSSSSSATSPQQHQASSADSTPAAATSPAAAPPPSPPPAYIRWPGACSTLVDNKANVSLYSMRFSTVLNSTTGSADSTADRVTSQIGDLSSVVATMHRKLRQAPLSSSSLLFRYYTTYDKSYVATYDVSQVELRRSGSLQPKDANRVI